MNKRATAKKTKRSARANGKRPMYEIVPELRRLREEAIASGMKLLTIAEIRREVARRRGAA